MAAAQRVPRASTPCSPGWPAAAGAADPAQDGSAAVRVWTARNRIGEAGEQTFRELEGFATDVDVAIVGLGN